MAKKNRKLKEDIQKRRETEALKAQAKYEVSPTPQREEKTEKSLTTTKNSAPQMETKYIKKDLLKSLILTLGALAIIAAAYFLLIK